MLGAFQASEQKTAMSVEISEIFERAKEREKINMKALSHPHSECEPN